MSMANATANVNASLEKIASGTGKYDKIVPVRKHGVMRVPEQTITVDKLPPGRLEQGQLAETVGILLRDGHTWEWRVLVEYGSGPLGRAEARQCSEFTDVTAAADFLAATPHVDGILFTAAGDDGRQVTIYFKNYHPPEAKLALAGPPDWREQARPALARLWRRGADPARARLYSRLGLSVIGSLVPLTASFFGVTAAAVLLVPAPLRHQYLWILTVAAFIAALKLAQLLSDRLLAAVLRRWPYAVWQPAPPHRS